MEEKDYKFRSQLYRSWTKTHDDLPVDTASFLMLSEEGSKEKISALNEILEKVGVKFSIEEVGREDIERLKITVDIDQYAKMTNRKAGGRSKKFVDNLKCKPTIKEFKELEKRMTNDELIEYLGCSRATFYRMKKKMDQKDEDMSFF